MCNLKSKIQHDGQVRTWYRLIAARAVLVYSSFRFLALQLICGCISMRVLMCETPAYFGMAM